MSPRSNPELRTRAAHAPRATKDALIRAALESFYEKGFEATSVQEIVDRAKLTKGAFYHHFQSKDDVLVLIHDAFMDQQIEIIDTIQGSSLTPVEALSRLIEEIVVCAETFRLHQTIFFEQRRFIATDRFAAVKDKRDRFELGVRQIIDRGIAAGDFVSLLNSRVIAFGIIGMSAWTYQWLKEGPLTPREIGRAYAQLVLEGLGAPTGSDTLGS